MSEPRDSAWTVTVWPMGFPHPFARKASSLEDARVVANEMLARYTTADSAWIRERPKLPPRAKKRAVFGSVTKKRRKKNSPLAGQMVLG